MHPKDREKLHDEVDVIPVLTAERQLKAPKRKQSAHRSPTKKRRRTPSPPVRSGPVAAGYESELASRSDSQDSFRLVLENDEDL